MAWLISCSHWYKPLIIWIIVNRLPYILLALVLKRPLHFSTSIAMSLICSYFHSCNFKLWTPSLLFPLSFTPVLFLSLSVPNPISSQPHQFPIPSVPNPMYYLSLAFYACCYLTSTILTTNPCSGIHLQFHLAQMS